MADKNITYKLMHFMEGEARSGSKEESWLTVHD